LSRAGPLRIALRGDSSPAPENTLAAFKEAVRLGADLVECDVHLSADDVPVIIHDDTVERTTNGKGAVAALPCARLRRLDAGAWFSSRFRGERIPTLEEALEWARGRCGLNLEIKGPSGRRRSGAAGAGGAAGRPQVALAVARALRRTGFKEPVIVSSFSPQALRAARAHMPHVRLGHLASRSLRGLRAAHRALGLYAVHPHVRLAASRRVRLAHRLGLLVLFWTVNDLPLMRRLLALGSDGLMTDDPALFQELG